MRESASCRLLEAALVSAIFLFGGIRRVAFVWLKSRSPCDSLSPLLGFVFVRFSGVTRTFIGFGAGKYYEGRPPTRWWIGAVSDGSLRKVQHEG